MSQLRKILLTFYRTAEPPTGAEIIVTLLFQLIIQKLAVAVTYKEPRRAAGYVQQWRKSITLLRYYFKRLQF